MPRHDRARVSLAALATAALLLCTGSARAADVESPLIEVRVGGTQAVAALGVTDVVVLEEAVCQVEISPEGLRIAGLTRGESVVFVWQQDRRVSLLVRVLPPAAPRASSTASQHDADAAGSGEIGTIVQTVVGAGVVRDYALQHRFDWSQQAGGRQLSLRALAFDQTAAGVPARLNAIALQYATPGATYRFADFSLSVNGGGDARLAGVSPFTAYALRGADALFTRGAGHLEVFGGTTVPVSFGSTRRTRAMAGMNVDAHPSTKLHLFTTTAVVGPGASAPGAASERRAVSPFQTAGLSYRFNERVAAQATGGASALGLYGDAAFVVASDRVSASVAGTASAPQFPLNQLQLLAGGTTSFRASAAWRVTDRMVPSLSYQHSATTATSMLTAFDAKSDYVNASLSLRLSRTQSLTTSGTWARNTPGPASGQTSLRRLDLGWAAQAFGRVTNNIRLSGNLMADAAQTRARLDTGLFENLSLRIGSADLNLGFQHSRRDPSLVARLRQEITLLPVDAQQQFLTDPVGFVQSADLSPAVRTLLNEFQSSDTEATVAGQFHAGQRLNLSVGYRFLLSAPTRTTSMRTSGLNYTLNYRVTRNWQLYSAVTDTVALDAASRDVTRNAVLSVGLSRSLHGSPSWLLPSARQRSLDGRVFVDRNINGVPDDTDIGLTGIVVRLENGQRTTTDAEGRFHFVGLKARAYAVSMALEQFQSPVRVTTPATVTVDLGSESHGQVGFGLVNFSRVMGTVFNDSALDGRRRQDAPGLQGVGVLITARDGTVARRVTTDGAGEYRVDDLEPGSYEAEVDPETVPANYVAAAARASFALGATRTAQVDVPLRALRSVSGRVVLIPSPAPGQAGEPAPLPLAGVVVVAGPREAVTDEGGYFILRDLPAGEMSVTLRTPVPLPDGAVPPTGLMRMPFEPTQVNDAVIVIRSADLAQRLQGQGQGQ